MPTYTIRKSKRAKNLRITIRPDESVIVTVPHRMSMEKAERFVREKRTWIEGVLDRLRRRPKPAYELPKASAQGYRTHKEEALLIARERLAHWNAVYGFSWKRVTIKNTKTRWGSCSRLGNINFSYRIAFLPPHLQDYLVVHELCHLGQMNHSPKFWKLVEKTMPDYAPCRRELRRLQ
jgi:predicted metal-dependent hydrolase